MDDATMVRPVLQISVVVILITMMFFVHQFAKVIVADGFGLVVIALLLASPRFLSRYLD